MITSDLINGLFELVGSIMLWRNVSALRKSKEVKGVSVATFAFFMGWGYWNIFYYTNLDQWLSFVGGVSVVVANTTWVVLAVYYGRRAKKWTR